ncbi:MAG: PAS domain-containing protein [Pseudomonadota bacterium]
MAATQPILAQIRSYWEELRAGRLMPLRSEIDPREMSPFLEVCFVLERQEPGDIRFRLAGMGVNDLMGMEVRGMQLRSLIAPEGRAQFSQQIDTLFTEPEIQVYKLMAEAGNSPPLTANMLLLPLKSDDGEADRAIGCLTTDGIVGIPPRRFNVSELQRTSLVTGLSQINAVITPKPSPLHPAGFAEKAQPFEQAAREQVQMPDTNEMMQTSVPYLKVVK